MSDFELIGEEEVFFGGEAGDMGDVGDETVCSNFSDVTIGQFGSAGALNNGGNAGPGKRSPVKSRPQTPTNRQPISTATTPKTTRPRSRHNNMQSSPDPPASPPNHNQTTNLLLDFTQQFDAITSRPPMPTTPLHRRTKSASPAKGGKTSPSKFALPPATPTEKKFFNLLDFSPGALASPRSVPSITPREVDQLKASFASQLSQLRAELNGREAEIIGLRDALRQSEVRYADANNGMKQQEDEFEEERNNWQNTKIELRQLFETERVEKETLIREMEKREDELRMLRERAEDALKELADAKHRVTYAEDEAVRAKKEAETAWKHAEKTQPSGSATPSSLDSINVQTEVEKVARELHSLYKAKHETKVTALKKSYEARWEKKVIGLQTELDTQRRRCGELEAQIQRKNEEEMTANIKYSASNAEELAALRDEVKRLGEELKAERREKGELVGAVEELLSIQASSSAAGGGELAEEREKVSRRVARVSGVGFGGSIGSNSGLKSEIERMGVGRK
ncbi:central kinetochore-associated-domain-containing protein [Tuber brumale]|nr:central kinetochore-associated-domain-containing protein [Tuber brumale]